LGFVGIDSDRLLCPLDPDGAAHRCEIAELDLTRLPGSASVVDAQELAADGITVNAVAPGEIATPMTGNEDVDPERVERPGIPMRRPGDAREIAAVIAFLASPEASYVTGASLVADGGLLLMAAIGNQDRKPERG